MIMYNPIRILKNIFNDFLLAVSGTWVGAPTDPPWDNIDD
jgi:hypothetical protein